MSYKKFAKPLLPVLLATVGMAGTAWAQGQPEPTEQQKQEQKRQKQEQQGQAGSAQAPQMQTEQAFAQMHAINQLESQVALMALNEAQSDRVVDYANDLAESHQDLDRRLLRTANQLDVRVAGSQQARQQMQQLQQKLQQQIQQLSQAQGADFDRAFINAMVTSHEQAIQQLRQARQQVQDPQGREIVDRSLRAMQKHLQDARELQQQLQPPQQMQQQRMQRRQQQ